MKVLAPYGPKQAGGVLPTLLTVSGRNKHGQIEGVAEVLNSRRPHLSDEEYEQLVHLVGVWEESGFDWTNTAVWIAQGVNLDLLNLAMERAVKFRMMLPRQSDSRGRAHLIAEPARDREGRIVSAALYQFWELVYYPDASKWWGGRCAECRKFFIKTSLRQRVYCRRACATKASSRTSKQRLGTERDAEKLKLIQRKIDEFSRASAKSKAGKCWKHEVSMSNPEWTVSFITRHVNRGSLNPPA